MYLDVWLSERFAELHNRVLATAGIGIALGLCVAFLAPAGTDSPQLPLRLLLSWLGAIPFLVLLGMLVVPYVRHLSILILTFSLAAYVGVPLVGLV